MKRLLYLLLLTTTLCAACQRAVLLPVQQAQLLPTVLVSGAMYYADFTVIKGFEATFMRSLQAPPNEQIVAEDMAKTGRYQVRLLAGQVYYIKLSLKSRNCLIETQEFAMPKVPIDTVSKNFFLHYPDSTEYGGCMAGWHPYR